MMSDPYKLTKEEKQKHFNREINVLTRHHYYSCQLYTQILYHTDYCDCIDEDTDSLPFLPVSLFKKYKIKSVEDSKVMWTLHSSGTTGSAPSVIYLDAITASNQQKALVNILQNFVGTKRLPMLILDEKPTRNSVISASRAGLSGFSLIGKNYTYVFDKSIYAYDLYKFHRRYENEPYIIYGLTSKVWDFFSILEAYKAKIDFKNAFLLHGGGWKKLEEQKVSDEEFKKRLLEGFNINKVHNYYGMIEQTGSIFMECEKGHLHCSDYSDIYFRNEKLELCEEGIIQVLSVLPESYPGHNIITEDLGVLLGEDDCSCGRKGKYFKFTGRLEQAQIRGCSNV